MSLDQGKNEVNKWGRAEEPQDNAHDGARALFAGVDKKDDDLGVEIFSLPLVSLRWF